MAKARLQFHRFKKRERKAVEELESAKAAGIPRKGSSGRSLENYFLKQAPRILGEKSRVARQAKGAGKRKANRY